MARIARKALADSRAIEEQDSRVVMRGRGAIVGAGATPSMGLSQFRGGITERAFHEAMLQKRIQKLKKSKRGGMYYPGGTPGFYDRGLMQPTRYIPPENIAVPGGTPGFYDPMPTKVEMTQRLLEAAHGVEGAPAPPRKPGPPKRPGPKPGPAPRPTPPRMPGPPSYTLPPPLPRNPPPTVPRPLFDPPGTFPKLSFDADGNTLRTFPDGRVENYGQLTDGQRQRIIESALNPNPYTFYGSGHNEDSSSDEECECNSKGCGMCGGAAPPGSTYRLALQRGGPIRYRGPPQQQIVPYVPRAPVGPITPYRPIRQPLPPPTTLITRPDGSIKPYSPAEAAARLAAMRGQPTSTAGMTAKQRSSYAAKLLALGIPAAALAAYLYPLGAAAAAAESGDSGDSGYYDDYAGEVTDNIGPITEAPERGPGGPIIDYAPPPTYMPADLTQEEVEFYLRSGNLPDRFISGNKRRGSGRKSARAEIVKKVMREHGLKLGAASKYVKEHGLF